MNACTFALPATLGLSLALGGCAGWPWHRQAGDDAAAVAAPALYELQVEAPDALRALLLDHLDLVRYRHAAGTPDDAAAELDRLVAVAPAQVRSLLETEGYYTPEVQVTRVQVAHETPDGAVPQIRVQVVAGPRTTVDSVQLDVTGDAAASDLPDTLRRHWALKAGQPLSAPAWSDAKRAALHQLHAEGYAAAAWTSTEARIDVDAHSAQLHVVADSGPRYRLGPLTIDGLQRYAEQDVRRLATFGPGDPYREQLLQDYQERLRKADLFESVVVELDADPATRDAAPVHVRVTEQPVQQATVGLGYAANTGPRVTLEHTHRKAFHGHWVARNKFELGPSLKSWDAELASHPLEGLYRNVGSGHYERLRSADEWRTTWTARAGRAKDTKAIARTYFAELTHSKLETSAGTERSDAASLNYHWTWRGVDNVLLPTQGTTLALQGAGGYADGHQLTDDEGIAEGRGPFARALGRLTWYRPFPADDTVVERWYLTARLEAGEVLARDRVSVPDPLLFRAGGDDSVRGYDYRTLGPVIDGAVTSGRMLATGSVEIARPISARRPQFLWAAFVDAGQAANRWSELHAAFGYGVGVRWRSPIGSMRVDLAYGQDVRRARLHVSVGVAL